ncbi:MAG TPA: hypothetical protein VFI16_11660, partial [Anaeromyxobacteraceae bacterium]|nr:hypothetical protein [Anaeromyxobacteraceae bacterium]
ADGGVARRQLEMEPEQAMSRFTCGECGKRYSTTDDPAPGRAYGIPCTCGHTIVVQVDERGQPMASAPPEVPRRSTPTEPMPLQPLSDDPFVRAMLGDGWQEPVAPPAAAAPVAGPRLARRDPQYAGRDEASDPLVSDTGDAALPETTRPRRLAGTRALLLDASVGLREVLGAGVRRVLRSRRLVAGGAVLGAIAFALGVWVGAGSTAARWKERATAATGAEKRPAAAEPGRVAAPGPVAAPVEPAAAGPAAAPGAARPAVAPLATAEPKVRPTAARAPAIARPRTIDEPSAEEPAAAAEPKVDPPTVEEPAPATDRMPKARQATMAWPLEPRDVEASGDLTVSLTRAPGAGVAADPEPAAAEPADASPAR